MDNHIPKKQLSRDQSVLVLSLVTDALNRKRAAVTFTMTSEGELIEISSGKVLLENKSARLSKHLK